MTRRFFILFLVLLLSTQSLFAQSGRGRPKPEEKPVSPPKPTTTPATTKPTTSTPTAPGKVAPGGGLVDQAQSGLTTRYVFKNGLTVIISEEHSTPLVTLMAYVKAGTVDEPETARGVARVAGEAVLRGTSSRSGDAWARQMSLAGATFQTEVDATATKFFASSPIESLNSMIELSADALAHPAFSNEALAKSVKAVQRNTAALGEDAPSYSAARWLSVAYPQNLLGRSEATAEQLTALKREAVEQFHAIRYTPQNTIICLTGDLIGPVVLRTLQQHFGGWSGAAGTSKLTETEQTALRYLEERGATTASWIHLGYSVPTVSADEFVAWDVVRAVLGLGRGARLVQSLRDTRGIVSDIRAELITKRNMNAFLIGLRVLPESIDRAEALTIEIVERLRRERISDGELQRAKSLLEKDFITHQETNEGRAQLLAEVETTLGFKAWSSYQAKLRQVTAEQVRAIAAKYLITPKLTVYEYQSPTAPPRTFTPEKYAETVGLLVPASTQIEIPADAVTDAKATPVIKHGTVRETQQDVGKFIVMSQPEPVKDYSTLRGPRAFVRVDPTRPLLVVGLFFQGGRSIEEESNNGITELMVRSMLRGTTKQPGDTLAAEMEQLGGELRVVNDMDYFGLELEILSRNSEEGLRRLVDILENPSFDKEAVKRERERLLADQLANRDAGSDQAIELARRSLFAQHTYAFPRFGTAAGVSKLTEADLQKWLERTVKRQYPLAVIVGDTEGSALVARVLANGFTRNDVDKSIKVRAATPASQPTEMIGTSARPVSYLTWLWTAPEGRDSASPEWRVIAEVLSTRLAQATEPTAGGSYFESCFAPHLQYSELWITAGGTSSDESRLKNSLETTVKSLERQPVSAEEWQGASRRAATHAAQDIESFSGRMRGYATTVFLGIPSAFIDQNVDLILRSGRDGAQSTVQAFSRSTPGRGVVRGTPVPAASTSSTPKPTTQQP